MSWIGYGLRRGVLTTRYPLGDDTMPPDYRGEIETLQVGREEAAAAAAGCLSNAISADERPRVDGLRCFQCGQCTRVAPRAFVARSHFELARLAEPADQTFRSLRDRARAFGRSVHLRHVDAGSDGSEEQELAAIFNPFYDANRLGIFLTATPRHADVLIVSGVVTKAMADPLRRTYEAMPDPKVVVALGTSACSGGIFADSPHVVGPVSTLLPVDVLIPGAPPSPLTILHGLWVALGHMLARDAAS
ncbi:MAG TPA: NADH-quinone oxidoreductase subunit B family protein [Candidatus Baltobacteraceae bacterium]|nr:NADH-quinone oxidoreductase subunit B family protein [Candidatus Baltobacteraceae bacterium]